MIAWQDSFEPLERRPHSNQPRSVQARGWDDVADNNEDADALEQEEGLVDDSLPQVSVPTQSAPSRPRRACKNCVCGRADGTNAEKSTVKIMDDSGQLLPPKEGGCGSCTLGDAFRCAGCPYRGQPPFKVVEGNVVKLGDT
eukprot:CAMPEP_0184492232 /NCGR_PEP_ID=MMETSP0113_2-20130426/22659_1 /TAXON_ID=91329 /ORGANISM="Norrisiella sphaerica, Strain BC52" /LENGTH=140 /DNA_ID=CAMNT_0026876913 /DNA_START=534 /DNA_END=956 /DNA_ORIENTATION=-